MVRPTLQRGQSSMLWEAANSVTPISVYAVNYPRFKAKENKTLALLSALMLTVASSGLFAASSLTWVEENTALPWDMFSLQLHDLLHALVHLHGALPHEPEAHLERCGERYRTDALQDAQGLLLRRLPLPGGRHDFLLPVHGRWPCHIRLPGNVLRPHGIADVRCPVSSLAHRATGTVRRSGSGGGDNTRLSVYARCGRSLYPRRREGRVPSGLPVTSGMVWTRTIASGVSGLSKEYKSFACVEL
eukprot:scaffold127937_cov72-Phaeocystis_antarctica.AAC.4